MTRSETEPPRIATVPTDTVAVPTAATGHAGTPAPAGAPRRRSWLAALLRGLWIGVDWFARIALTAWATLALYYSNLPWAWARLALAAAFLIFSVWALWRARRAVARLAWLALFVAVLAWHVNIKPSHDRPWRPEVAVMPRATIDGDRVRVSGVRNFAYRSRDDFTARYEERELSLAHVTSLDFFVSYWKAGPVAHTFVSFNFDNAPPLCISIETRPEVGEGFDPLASLFKQFELIYIVGDERDLVGLRTNHRDEEVFLYRIRASPEAVRRLLCVYLERINELADRPEFYHLLSNSCTINIVRYANAAGRVGWLDIRHLLNGLVDRYLFAAGLVDTSLPFAELRRRSHINEAARSAGDAPPLAGADAQSVDDGARAADDPTDFSNRIRAGRPVPPPP